MDLSSTEAMFKNSKPYVPDAWEKGRVDCYGLNCPCGGQFKLYELDAVGYKAGRCEKCGEATCLDTNIIVVLFDIVRKKREKQEKRMEERMARTAELEKRMEEIRKYDDLDESCCSIGSCHKQGLNGFRNTMIDWLNGGNPVAPNFEEIPDELSREQCKQLWSALTSVMPMAEPLKEDERKSVELVVKEGMLYYGETLIVCRYDEGDCDTIGWPFEENDQKNLIRALYDMRETGQVPSDVQMALLPDGGKLSF